MGALCDTADRSQNGGPRENAFAYDRDCYVCSNLGAPPGASASSALLSSSSTQSSAIPMTAVLLPSKCSFVFNPTQALGCDVSGIVPNPSPTQTAPASSLNDCAMICKEASCGSLGYDQSTGVCSLYAVSFNTLYGNSVSNYMSFVPYYNIRCFACPVVAGTSSTTMSSTTALPTTASPTTAPPTTVAAPTDATSTPSSTTRASAAPATLSVGCSQEPGIVNGDFKTGSMEPINGGVTGGVQSIVSDATLCHSGQRCLALSTSVWLNSVVEIGVPTTIGETYAFSAWARASQAGMDTCYVTYQLNVNNTGPGFLTVANVDSFPNTEWIHSTGTYVAVTDSSNFYLNIYCPDIPQLPIVSLTISA